MTKSDTNQAQSGYIVSAEFTHGGKTHRNYLVGNSLGFRSWAGDCARAKRFDTRALARRAARGMQGIRVDLCKGLAEQSS